MRIGIKVGSVLIAGDVELRRGYPINEKFIFNLCRQIVHLWRCHHEVFLVTSGAVACDNNMQHSRALRAAIGQGRLIGKYIEFFRIFSVEAAQMLLVAFELKANREHIRSLFQEAFQAHVIPIINANDAVNSDELDRLENFADNDVLFTELCLMLQADLAIFTTDRPGLVDEDGGNHVIRAINDGNWLATLAMATGGNARGHGDSGMITKLECGKKLAETQDIRTIIVKGVNDDNFVLRAVDELLNPTGSFGTVFRFTPVLPLIE